MTNAWPSCVISLHRMKIGHWLARFALFATLACAATWPLLRHLTTHYPLGSESVATVPFASAWALWWTEDRLLHGLRDYWAAPIFYPVRDAFALSEPIPLLGLFSAPLLMLGAPLVLAYNLTLLSCLTINGLAAYMLLRAQRLREPAALAAASCVCVMPAVYHQLGVLTLVPLAGLIAAVHCSLRLVHVPRLRAGVGLGLAIAATYACCGQYGLLLVIALGPALLVALGRRSFTRPRLTALALAGVIALAGVAPIVLAQREAVKAHKLVRSEQRAHDGSAALRSYIRSPPSLLPAPPGVSIDERSRTSLYPGVLRFALACLGFYAVVRQRTRRRTLVFLVALTLSSAILSMSGRIGPSGFTLHGALAAFVPGLSQVRSVWRAGMLTQLVLTLATAWGLQTGLAWAARRELRWRLPLAAAVVGLAVLEVWPARHALAAAPDERAHAAWASYMRRELAPGEPYCVLPFAERDGVAEFERFGRFMVLTAMHGRPMLNGYSSYFPEPHEQLWQTRPRFGSAKTATILRKFDVRQVVTYGPALGPPGQGGWNLAFEDTQLQLRVYELP